MHEQQFPPPPKNRSPYSIGPAWPLRSVPGSQVLGRGGDFDGGRQADALSTRDYEAALGEEL